MIRLMKRFAWDETGAVTVDWVVLTAAVVGFGTAVILTISNGALHHSNGLGAHLLREEVTTAY